MLNRHIVYVVQPYVPEYRVPLFEAMRQALKLEGIDLRLVVGAPVGAQARRNDAAQLDWATFVPTRTLQLGKRSVTLANTSSYWAGSSGVVLPLMGSRIDVYRAIARRRRGLKVGLWGHVRDYVASSHPIDAAAEKFQMRHADQIFAYTEGGASYARAVGVPSARVTTLNNTVDLASLRSHVKSITEKQVASFKQEHQLNGPVYAYIGGIDRSKGIEFLAEALDHLWVIAPGAKLLVGGRGDDEALLDAAVARGQAIMLGFVGDAEKAMIARTATVLLNPGRIGLIAVEALELRLPILTTEWKFHGPEREYLSDRRDVFAISGPPREYALQALEIAQRPVQATGSQTPELSDMVANFNAGIVRMLRL